MTPWPSEEALRIERRWAAAQLHPEELDYLRDLPTTLQQPLGAGPSLLMCHATPSDRQVLVLSHSPTNVLYDIFFAPYPGVRMAAYGHTHIPYVRFLKGVVVVNTGSVGTPTDGAPTASYAVVEIDGSDLEVSLLRVAYDVERARAPSADRLSVRGVHGGMADGRCATRLEGAPSAKLVWGGRGAGRDHRAKGEEMAMPEGRHAIVVVLGAGSSHPIVPLTPSLTQLLFDRARVDESVVRTLGATRQRLHGPMSDPPTFEALFDEILRQDYATYPKRERPSARRPTRLRSSAV